LNVGSRARVQISATGQTVEGQVVEVASAAGPSGLVEVVVSIPEGGLTPGASVQVFIQDQTLPDGFVLPFGSFRSETDGSATVFVLTDDGTVRAQKVEIGVMTDGGAIAVSGLNPGDIIAAKGAKRLRDGERVDRASLSGGRFNG
jgi:multidrug efflux pump subunit AcrA (membrane-fusion protein)